MTNEEVEALIVSAHWRLFRRMPGARQFFGVVILACLPGLFIAAWSIAALFIASLAATFWFAIEGFARIDKRELGKVDEAALWDEITREKGGFGIQNPANSQLQMRMSAFYQREENSDALPSDALPMKQAVRLLDTFVQQQRRLESVEAQLNRLGIFRKKVSQLSELGGENSRALAKLSQIAPQEASLNYLAQEIQSSCHRLEAILTEIEKSAQIKRLQNEISELSSIIEPSVTESGDFVDEGVKDIERQITREIQAFQQLQRETDRHLRDL